MWSIPDTLIGALIALCGVVVAQLVAMVQSRIDRNHKQSVHLQQKYEEMMFHFSASLVWIVDLNGSTNQEAVYSLAQCPEARKCLTLCLLYFREIAPYANDYILAQETYYNSVVLSYSENCVGTAGAQVILKCKDSNEIFNNFKEKKISLENQIISKSKNYTY